MKTFIQHCKAPFLWVKGMSKKRKRLFFLGAAFLCLILAASYTVFVQPLMQKEKWIYKEAVVEKGILAAGVTESGSLEYGITSQMYNLNLTVSEEEEDNEEEEEETVQKYLQVEEVYTALGKRIAEGDALMKFTPESVEAVRKLLLGAQTEAQVAYAEAESEYNLSVLQAKLQMESDNTSAKYAGSIYKYANQAVNDSISADTLEIERLTGRQDNLQVSYEEALANLEEARKEYEEAQTALEAAGDNEHVYIPMQSTLLNAKSRYEQAQTKAEQTKQSIEDNRTRITALQSEVDLAQSKKTISYLETKNNYESDTLTGEIAQIAYEAKLESLKEELTEAEDIWKGRQEQMEAFEAFVGEDGILYASGSGIVTEVGYGLGDTLTTAGTAVSYASEEDMTITIDVSQEDIISMNVGDAVDIVFSAYDGISYGGVITAIDTTNTSENSATVSYPVTIAVQGDTSVLYGGMTADVTFVTESKEDVLYLSKKAIVHQNGKAYVYTDNELGKKVLQEVETGLSNGVYIEIISGLEEGDTIYIASKVSNEEEANNSEVTVTGTESEGQEMGGPPNE